MRRFSLEWAFDDKFLVLDLVVVLVNKRLQLKIALSVTEFSYLWQLRFGLAKSWPKCFGIELYKNQKMILSAPLLEEPS